MTDIDPRDPQTIIKHEILEEYLYAWSGIITAGLKRQYDRAIRENRASEFQVHFVYVDCHAHTGIYQNETQLAYGSPLIGIQALDKLKTHTESTFGYTSTVNVILVEKEKTEYTLLLETLNKLGYTDRIVESPKLGSLKDTQIAIFKGDYEDYIDEILAYTGGYTFSLYLLDPYGSPGAFSTIGRVTNQKYTDTIIYFPYQDLLKKLGSLAGDSPSHRHHKHLQRYDEMFGSDMWRYDVFLLEQADITKPSEIMPTLVEKYEELLQDNAPDLAVKKLPLKMKNYDRINYYLYLTTDDPTGALKLNEILDLANIRAVLYREERLLQKKQQTLFPMDDMLEATKKPEEQEVDVNRLAADIYEKCRGKKMVFRDLLRLYINSPYYKADFEKSIRRLRDQKLVLLEPKQLRNNTKLNFK